MKPLASLSSELTTAARRALMVLRDQKLNRTRGGWSGPGTQRISLDVAAQLKAFGLARAVISNGRHQLIITGAGRMLAQIFGERAERRQA